MGEAALKEPTMEDILSSIRKIISEEGGSNDSLNLPRSAEASAAVEEEPEMVAVKTEAFVEAEVSKVEEAVTEAQESEDFPVESNSEAAVESTVVDADDKVVEADVPPLSQFASEVRAARELVNPPPAAPVMPEKPAEEVSQVQMADATPSPKQESVSMDAAHSDDETEAFRGALMSPSSGGAVSGSFDRLKRSALDDVEAKTEAILRPMLREWLDENLPTLVERLVREEIERVARGT